MFLLGKSDLCMHFGKCVIAKREEEEELIANNPLSLLLIAKGLDVKASRREPRFSRRYLGSAKTIG